MIDDKINNSLKEIERELQNISSARTQVDKTVASYEELKIATDSYTKSLKNVTEELTSLVNTIRIDYNEIISDFKKQQKDIVTISQSTLDSLSEASEHVKTSVSASINSIQKKLIVSIILNVVIIGIGIVITLHFIK